MTDRRFPRRSSHAGAVNERGIVALIVAIMLPVLIGAIGMGIEIGSWYLTSRRLQNAADAAAIAAAHEIYLGTEEDLQTVGEAEAARNGLDLTEGGTVAINHPPLSGAWEGDDSAVEAVVTQPESVLFIALFLSDDVIVEARASAMVEIDGEACVLTLDPTACGAIDVGGTGDVVMEGCQVAANSICEQALTLSGSGHLVTPSAHLVGDYDVGGSAIFDYVVSPAVHRSPLPNPYEDLEIPPYSGCDYNNYTSQAHTVVFVHPGVYCGGMKFNAHSVTTFLPGNYIIDGGGFSVSGSATLLDTTPLGGAGIHIFMTSSTGTDYPDIIINGGATVTLTAGATGDYSGILFFGDPDAPNDVHKFNGGSTTEMTGALYFPSQELEYTGGNVSGGTCTQLVARSVTFNGSANVNNDCVGMYDNAINIPSIPKLVE